MSGHRSPQAAWHWLGLCRVLSLLHLASASTGPRISARMLRRSDSLAAAARDDSARTANREQHLRECLQSEQLFFAHAPLDGAAEPESFAPVGWDGEWESFAFSGRVADGLDATPPRPYGLGDLARVSRAPLFLAAECAAVIAEAEADSAWRGAQPLAAYANSAACFRPVRELPATLRWLNLALERTIYPAVLSAFAAAELAPTLLRCSAASIVKYNATAGQTGLAVHRDGPGLAITIPLNQLSEYDGGGTFIEALEEGRGGVLRRPAGHLILHPASLRHGGATITCGLRYILVVWLFSSKPALFPHGHFSTQRAARMLASALRITNPIAKPSILNADDILEPGCIADPGGNVQTSALSGGSAYRRDLLNAAAKGFEEAGLGPIARNGFVSYDSVGTPPP